MPMPGSTLETASPTIDQSDRSLLVWLARGVGAGAFSGDRVPSEREIHPSLLTPTLTVRQAVERAQRWSRLLFLAHVRPEKCALMIARGILAEGFDRATLRIVLSVVAPRFDLGSLPTQVDRGYMEAELLHLTTPSYEAAIVLARAAATYDAEFAYVVASEATNMVSGRYDAELCLAWICERSGRFDRTCDHYALAARKGCETCRVAWARAANRAGRHQTAIDIVEGAKLTRPADLLVEKARALRALKTPAEALQAFQGVDLDRLPDRMQAEAEIADCNLALGRYHEAALVATAAARSGNRLGKRVLGLALYRDRKWTEAAPVLRAYGAGTTDDTEVWRALAECCLTLGRHVEAVNAAQAALRHDAQDRAAGRLLGQALIRLSRYDEALDICTRFGWDILPYPYLARLLIDTNQLDAAAEFVAIWAERRPNDMLAWMYRGYLAEQQGRLRDALVCYEEALRRNPHYAEAQRRWEVLRDALDAPE